MSAFEFLPEEDITAFELAKILSMILSSQNAAFPASMLDDANLDERTRRHFKAFAETQAKQFFALIG